MIRLLIFDNGIRSEKIWELWSICIIHSKGYGSVLDEKSSFNALALFLIRENVYVNLFYKVFFSEVLLYLPSDFPWHIVVIFLLLISSLICWVSYRKEYLGHLVLSFLLLLIPWFIVKMCLEFIWFTILFNFVLMLWKLYLWIDWIGSCT